MKEKFYDGISSLVVGILFVFWGILLFIWRESLYENVVEILVIVLIGREILSLIKCVFGKKNSKYLLWLLLFNFVCCFVLCVIPRAFLGVLPFLFSFYLIIIGIVQFIRCFLEIRDRVYVHFSYLLMGFIYFVVALPILVNPLKKIDIFITCLSIYILLLGFSYILYTIGRIVPIKHKNRIKRRIKVTLPKIIEAIIPYSVMMEINRNLDVNIGFVYDLDSVNKDVDLHILIHTSSNGNNKMGHMDLIFDNKVYSYGNYDEGSRRFNEVFGDGVLFSTDKIKEYINFCIDNSKKTVFDFGIILNDKEKSIIRDRIKFLFDNTIVWNYRDDKKYNNGNSYAGKLYKRTGAKFYKFTKTKYKTYFVLGTNCCYLVDDIVRKSGMDIISINGIITPGTYYDYLNKSLRLKKSRVISKDIYNKNKRP